MKRIIYTIFFIGNIFTISCQENKKNVQPKNELEDKNTDTKNLNNSKNMLDLADIKKHIELQKRIETDEEEFDNPYEYTEKDLELALKIIHIGLLNSGYDNISDADFKDKMRKIFNYEINYNVNCSHNWYYLNDNRYKYILYGFSYRLDNKIINAEDLKFGSFNDVGNYFFSKEFHFMTILPYLKNLIQINSDDSYKIKIPYEIISRNKYLFNDDQSQFAWLINNDEYFMRSLVTTFGYTEDKKLLKWVIENTELPYFDKNAKTENLKDLSKLLWTKDCNGNIRVHQNTLDLIKELSTPNDNLYIKYIAEYISNYMVSFPFKEEELTIEQQAKIAAYILYWGEQYKYDKQYNYNQMFMTRFYNYNYQKDLYEKEFIKNNYYGLPKFKEWYEAAKKEKDYFNGGKGMEDDPQPTDYESRAKYIK
ncbi:hypothetical protein O2K51_01255 [Apibacter raozihei]|uniref:hypothetical protein n=1 Tax=Apibacter raozihei TaxID=2500547 RepID=UPI000FE31031|nr:hypothetical protein [Apibacter raozihei]